MSPEAKTRRRCAHTKAQRLQRHARHVLRWEQALTKVAAHFKDGTGMLIPYGVVSGLAAELAKEHDVRKRPKNWGKVP
jgi:hypothetical protein